MLAGAGDVEEAALGVVDVVQFRSVCGVGDAIVEEQDAVIAGHDDNGAKPRAFGQAHGAGCHGIGAGQTGDRGAGAGDKLRGADEEAGFAGAIPAASQASVVGRPV